MNLYGLCGFILGFVCGMMLNAWLLRGVPRAQILKDKSISNRYGLLNWGIALFGMLAGLAVQHYGF